MAQETQCMSYFVSDTAAPRPQLALMESKYAAPLTITLFETVPGPPTAQVLSDTMMLLGGGHCRLRTILASAENGTTRNLIFPLVSDCQKLTASST